MFLCLFHSQARVLRNYRSIFLFLIPIYGYLFFVLNSSFVQEKKYMMFLLFHVMRDLMLHVLPFAILNSVLVVHNFSTARNSSNILLTY